MADILEIKKTKVLILSDGKEYKLPPINLTTLANVERTLGFGLNKLGEKLETETVTTMRSVIYALLREEQPGLDIETVGKLITLKELSAISETIRLR